MLVQNAINQICQINRITGFNQSFKPLIATRNISNELIFIIADSQNQFYLGSIVYSSLLENKISDSGLSLAKFEYEEVTQRGFKEKTQFPADFVPTKIILNKPQNKLCIFSSNYFLVAEFPSRYQSVKNSQLNQSNLHKP